MAQPVRLLHNIYAMPVALEDAAHLSMTEDDLARLMARLTRDPSSGRKGERYWSKVFGDVTARYQWELTGGSLEVYLLRLVPRRAPPRNFAEARRIAKQLAVGVVQKKLNDLLEAGE